MAEAITAILTYWFGALDDNGLSAPEQHGLWFKSGLETDQQCREKFGDQVSAATRGELQHWQDSDSGLVALILLLDQVTRNIYRNTPQAFCGDARALTLALDAIAAGRHRQLPAIHRVFLLLPLEHSEKLEVQEQCVALFAGLVEESGEQAMGGFRQYAVAHRDVIALFGRFPHRNAVLGRHSTPEEREYLATHGGF
jgi:uncharacterized protein (DUF924 family)